MKPLIFCLFFLYCNSSFAQKHISGTVSVGNGIAINGASVVLYAKNTTDIITYAVTNAKGIYTISVDDAADSFDIEISHIGYATIQQRIANKDQQCNFILHTEKIELPEVIVNSKIPITKRGDTLNYDVKTFTAKTDRVIADVIKKLPGITVEANGQIKYNGKPISNYYIDGLDLLESKYNIANNNIPAGLVDKVQVLENHQPIKALDSMVFSDKAALNIRLNKKAKDKFITTAKIGLGVAPLLWQDEIVTFNFRKNFQFITGYKTNNTGYNIAQEINDVTVDQFNNLHTLTGKQDIVSLETIAVPPFESNRYLFNKTHLFYSNGLFVINNSAQLKYNMSYLNNTVQQAANARTIYFLPQDTINIMEDQYQNVTGNKFLSDFGLTVNRPDFYIKNNLKLEGYWTSGSGVIENPTTNTTQQIKAPLYQAVNNLHIIFSKNKTKTEFNSNTILKHSPQQLAVTPGPFADFFNQSAYYQSLVQNATQRTTATDNYVLLQKHLLGFSQSIKIGFAYQNSSINSSITKYSNNNFVLLADSFKNELRWQEIKPYTELGFYIFKKGYHFNFTSTLLNNTLKRVAVLNGIGDTKNYLFFNNEVTIKKDLGAYYNASLMLATNSAINSIDENTTGYILTSYRNISKNNFVLQKSTAYNSGLFITYRNLVKALFGYFSLSYSITDKNVLTTVSYIDQLQTKNAIKRSNRQKTLFLLFGLNKYFKKNQTTVGVSGLFSNTSYPQLLQNELSNIYNKTVTLKINAATRKIAWFYPELYAMATKVITKINAPQNTNAPAPITQLTTNLNLNFFITDRWIITQYTSFYHTGQNSSGTYNLFIDCGLAYKKGKYDLEFKLLNLSNARSFKAISSSENIQSLTNYQLRPINALIQFYLKL